GSISSHSPSVRSPRVIQPCYQLEHPNTKDDHPACDPDPEQALTGPHLTGLPDAGLCHGLAGVYQAATRAASDAITPSVGAHLPALAAALTARTSTTDGSTALLTGTTGVQLVPSSSCSRPPAAPPCLCPDGTHACCCADHADRRAGHRLRPRSSNRT
ncbi:hypothetical protein AB1460_35300, partial [Parafrankia sp. FMc2]